MRRRSVGLVGRPFGTITAPARLAAVGTVGASAGTVRQFAGEARVQQQIGAAAGQSIGRMGSAAAAFHTSTIPAVATARGFVQQTQAIRAGAAAAGAADHRDGRRDEDVGERSSALSQARAAFTNAASGAERFGRLAGAAAAGGNLLKNAATDLSARSVARGVWRWHARRRRSFASG
jgi:hypothetical protein